MSYSFDETYRVYSEVPTKARRPRGCGACERTIATGHVYMRVSIIGGQGDASNVDRCGACQMTHEHLRTLDPGEMWPDEWLSCGLSYEGEWENEPPADVQAFAFATDEGASSMLTARRDSRLQHRAGMRRFREMARKNTAGAIESRPGMEKER